MSTVAQRILERFPVGTEAALKSGADILLLFAHALWMGGERASSVRRCRAGKICCNCRSSLPPPDRPGERYCKRCETDRAPRRRVHMNFMLRERWMCSFLEEDLKTPLPRKVTFSDPQKMLEFVQRGGCILNLEDRQAFEHGLSIGRGGLWLNLTAEQYTALNRGSA